MITATARDGGRLLEVREMVIHPPGSLSVRESDGTTARKLFLAKVGHCDKPTLNGAVYPRSLWEETVAKLKPLCAAGRVKGGVDHLDRLRDSNLADAAIVWRDLEIEHDTGAVFGRFEVVKDHPKGRALLAQIDAGVAIGFSLHGDGRSHRPTAEERRKYRIPPDDPDARVMDRVDVRWIDAVEDPAVPDAFLVRESKRRGRQPPGQTEQAADPSGGDDEVPDLFADDDFEVPPALAAYEQAVRAANAGTSEAAAAPVRHTNIDEDDLDDRPDHELTPAQLHQRDAQLVARALGEADRKADLEIDAIWARAGRRR